MDALADPLPFRSESGSNPKARWFRRQRKQLLIGAVAIGLTGAAVWFGWQWWTIGRFIELPPERMLFTGMSIGYADRSRPLDALVTERAPLDEVAEFVGI